MTYNYYKKYLKYKTKFIMLKGGSYPYNNPVKLTEKEIELLKDHGYTSRMIREMDYEFGPLKSIKLIEENPELLEYNAYEKGEPVPPYDILLGTLKFIKFIEENKELFPHLDKDKLLSSPNVKNHYINTKYPELKQYEKYRNDNIIQSIDEIIKDIKTIELIKHNPILNEHFGYEQKLGPKSINDVKKDLDQIDGIKRGCIQYPGTFYISGLKTFSVYINKKLNKMVCLLGETHDYDGICDRDKRPVYTANEFFFSLLNCFASEDLLPKHKLDVFLEARYYATKYWKFDGSPLPVKSYMAKTMTDLYEMECKPSYLKLLMGENKICKYGNFARFHHADIRFAVDTFASYILQLFLMSHGILKYDNIDVQKLYDTYESYNEPKLSDLLKKSILIPKIKKQIENIEDPDTKKKVDGLYE